MENRERLDFITSKYESYANNGCHTMAGLLRKTFFESDEYEGLNRIWNEDTQAKYIHDYSVILEKCPRKGMDEYSILNVNSILLQIEEEKRYSKERMGHFAYLIKRLYLAGIELELYMPKIKWEEALYSPEDPDDNAVEGILKKLKRSLDEAEENRVLKWFKGLDPVTATGEEIGLALMFFLGLRNNEACGLDYSAIKPVGQQGRKCAYIYQSTSVGGNKLKPGGKTANAIRMVPCPFFLVDFLEKRLEFIKTSVGQLDLSEENGSVRGLPIVCKKDLATRCGTTDLTKAGRRFFREMKIGTMAMYEQIRVDALEQISQGSYLIEKDPTPYLFRRNYATHLYCLGFPEAEIQYLIGHEIEDYQRYRNFYTNLDEINSFFERMEMHPFNLYFKKS